MKRLIILLALWATPALAQNFQADSKISVASEIMTTSSNVTTTVKATAGTFYGLEAGNVGTSTLFIKLYNAAAAVCGVGTPQARYVLPAVLSGANLQVVVPNGVAYSNGISVCIVKGITDGDATAPNALSGMLNILYK